MAAEEAARQRHKALDQFKASMTTVAHEFAETAMEY
jgi:hypothetical protein